MYFIHKVESTNETFNSISLLYYGNESQASFLQTLNSDKIIIDANSVLTKNTAIYLPKYFRKNYSDFSLNFFNYPIDDNTDLCFDNLNFSIDSNLDIYYFVYDKSHDYKTDDFFNYQLNFSNFYNRMRSFSFPTSKDHIFLFKKYGTGRILFLPHIDFLKNIVLKDKDTNGISLDNFSEKILQILNKSPLNDQTVLNNILDFNRSELIDFDEKIILNNLNKNQIDFINCEYNKIENENKCLERLYYLISNIFNDGGSLIVILNANGNVRVKRYFREYFGVDISDRRIQIDQPFGFLFDCNNYEDISIIQPQLDNPNILLKNQNKNDYEIEFYHNINEIPLTPIENSYECYLTIKNNQNNIDIDRSSLKSIKRIKYLLYLLYYFNNDLFRYVTCIQKNFYLHKNFQESDLDESFRFRLFFLGKWQEISVKKKLFISNKFCLETLVFFISIAICELILTDKTNFTNYNFKNFFPNYFEKNIKNISTKLLIYMFFGENPILINCKKNFLKFNKGLCLVLKNESEFRLDYLKDNFLYSDDKVIEEWIWIPSNNKLKSNYETLYKIDYKIENSIFLEGVYEYLIENLGNVFINFKNFVPLFIPKFYKIKQDDYIVTLDLSFKNISFEIFNDIHYSVFIFDKTINDLKILMKQENLNAKFLSILKDKQPLDRNLINIKIKYNQVLLLLFEHKKKIPLDLFIEFRIYEQNQSTNKIKKHIVEKNDNLKSLAKFYYDKEDLWYKIFDANKSELIEKDEELSSIDLFNLKYDLVLDIPILKH